MTDREGLKVGDVARRTGLTVRTLHHYDEIGLVRPSARSRAGHRLYTAPDLTRLQAVVSLKQLGFSLDEVRAVLDGTTTALGPILELHLADTAERVATLNRLTTRLSTLAARLRQGEALTLDALLEAIEETTVQAKFLTREQLEQIRERQPTREAVEAAEKAWRAAAVAMKAALDRGAAPDSPEVKALAVRWRGLVHDLSGGDPGIEAGLAAFYRADPDACAARLGLGLDRTVLEYAGRAMRTLKS